MRSRRKKLPAPGPGAVLGSEVLRPLLGQIFLPGSYSEDQLRPAAYDVRLGDDLLLLPPISPGDPPKRLLRGQRQTTPFILDPGDVAIVSTREKVTLPWDIAANISMKFRLARQGLLLFTGLFVDPGFGRKPDNSLQAEPQALHFMLANVGPEPIPLEPGKTIAALQFFCVTGDVDKRDPANTQDVIDEYFDPDRPPKRLGLEFFGRLADVANLKSEFGNLKVQIRDVVLFSYVLFGVTLMIALVAALVQLVSAEPGGDDKADGDRSAVDLDVLAYVLAGLIGLGGVLLLGWMVVRLFQSMGPAWERLRRRRTRRRAEIEARKDAMAEATERRMALLLSRQEAEAEARKAEAEARKAEANAREAEARRAEAVGAKAEGG